MQERELIMLPGTCVRVSNPGRNMGKKLWEFSLCVDSAMEQMIDFKHPHWGSIISPKPTAGSKVRACMLRTTDRLVCVLKTRRCKINIIHSTH